MADDSLAIHAETETDIEEAFAYIEQERPGHGQVFLERYRELVDEAIATPGLGVKVPGYPDVMDVRKHMMTQFEYSLVVATIAGRRTVAALHFHRNSDRHIRHRLLK